MASPGTYSPTFVQGDDWEMPLSFTDDAGDPMDLTGYSFLAQARTRAAASSTAFAFTVDTTDAATGVIVLSVANATTDDVGPGRYEWDLQWTDPDSKVRTLMRGVITVIAEVARP